jgi:hypothetical protein
MAKAREETRGVYPLQRRVAFAVQCTPYTVDFNNTLDALGNDTLVTPLSLFNRPC